MPKAKGRCGLRNSCRQYNTKNDLNYVTLIHVLTEKEDKRQAIDFCLFELIIKSNFFFFFFFFLGGGGFDILIEQIKTHMLWSILLSKY